MERNSGVKVSAFPSIKLILFNEKAEAFTPLYFKQKRVYVALIQDLQRA